jgi:hypothetical protein
MTETQEHQLRALLATAIKRDANNDSQEGEEWTDAFQYGENVSDAYDSGIGDGKISGEANMARKVLAILDAK